MPSADRPHILVLGANGQVGRALVKALNNVYTVTAGTRDSAPVFDLTDTGSLTANIKQVSPDVVINAAAYTAVDKAETEIKLANTINAIAPGIIANVCASLHISLIHYSTDYVFDGTKSEPYTEIDTPCPINVYGQSKLRGEQAIQESGCEHYIFRTSWVYDAEGQNFLNTMLRLARERDALSIIDDQHGSPTWAGYIAQETANLVKLLIAESKTPQSGIYNLTCSGSTTWFGFATAIFELGLDTGLINKLPEIAPIPTEAYPTPAKRPLNSSLNNEKWGQLPGSQPMLWQKALHKCLEQYPEQN